jgi:hypothetical protein
MATEAPRDDGAGRVSLKGRLAAIASAIAAIALLISNVDKIWITVSGWFPGKEFPKMTITTTVYPDEECHPIYGIRTMSTINVGMNNRSDRDIILTSVELFPEWITGFFWGGLPVVSKEYTVILDDWYELALVARLPDKPEQRERMFANRRIKEDKDWYFDQETIFWVKPEPLPIKEIPADVFTVEAGRQEKFQISLGLSSSDYYLYGTVRLNIQTDDGTKHESEPLKFSICKN